MLKYLLMNEAEAAEAPAPAGSGEPETPPVETPPETPAVGNWRDEIKDESLSKFASNYSSIEDLAKSGLEFRQKLSNAVSIPGKDADEKEISAFNKRLGVPDNASDYDVAYPEEFDEELKTEALTEMMTGFKDVLHKSGATPTVANAVFDHMLNMINNEAKAEEDAYKAVTEKADGELRKEWGAEYDTNKEYAKRAFTQFGDDGFTELVENATFGELELHAHPAMLKAFANIGRRMGEGGLETVITADQKTDYETQINDLTAEAHAALGKGDRIKSDQLFAQRDKISRELYGS